MLTGSKCMSEAVDFTTADFRGRVVVFLAFLTSEACLEACRRYAAAEALAATLTRLWFDEIYVPGERYLDGVKGDRSNEEVARFRTCFTEGELADLERFHGCFELRLDLVSNRAHGRAFFPDNDSWRSLLRDAARLVDALQPDADRLRKLLAGFVEEALGEGDSASLLATLRQPKHLISG